MNKPALLDSEQELLLEFDSAQLLYSLFANDPKELKYAEEKLGLNLVSRDGWILAKGSEASLQRLKLAFEDLQRAVKSGAILRAVDFRLAIDLAADAKKGGVADLVAKKILAQGQRSVRPRTPQQLKYLEAMGQHDLVFGLGPAGTGKTYLAMAMGLALLKSKEVSRIILTRPAVEAGEALGFLPGDLRDKVAPYLRPLYDAMHDMLPAEETARYLEEGIIEIAPLAYMRGRTLSRSFVILDEAQNTTCEQMFMFLTRLGEGSRCVVTGDTSQIDLKPGMRSGLVEAIQALKEMDEMAMIYFDASDVVRHPLVAKVIEAYTKHRQL